MEEYIKNYELFDKKIVYNFNLGSGGIGDNIKFFMYILGLCMKDKKRLYYQKNNDNSLCHIHNFYVVKLL